MYSLPRKGGGAEGKGDGEGEDEDEDEDGERSRFFFPFLRGEHMRLFGPSVLQKRTRTLRRLGGADFCGPGEDFATHLDFLWCLPDFSEDLSWEPPGLRPASRL